MWPFKRTTRSDAQMGNCPACDGRIGLARPACRNRLSIPTCTHCKLTLDHTYSPSWVFLHVQTERRKLTASHAKNLLKDAQLSPPAFLRTRYWKVYSIADVVDVCYDSNSGAYDIFVDGETEITNQNIGQLTTWMASLELDDYPIRNNRG
jgi:hypothetical protein